MDTLDVRRGHQVLTVACERRKPVVAASHPWGEPLWSFPIGVAPHTLDDGMTVDVAIVGAGFTGLATAYYVLRQDPRLRVAVFESHHIGAGASGRTGGLVLEDTAVGPLEGVGDCVATLQTLVATEAIDCDLQIHGVWEIGRRGGKLQSPLQWTDEGILRVVYDIPGGAFDPRRFLGGMLTCIERAGGQVFEHAPVTNLHVEPQGDVRLQVDGKTVIAGRAVFATNAFCLSLLGLSGWAEDIHTIAVATEALPQQVFETIGWGSHTPFYTLDYPYLWGRVTAEGCMILGGGLTGRGQVAQARVDAADTLPLFQRLEQRIHHLHPAMQHVRITHRWLGPLCFTEDSKPIITYLGEDQRVLLATGYRGHGVALSVRVGKLLAEVMAGQGHLPAWSYRPTAFSSR